MIKLPSSLHIQHQYSKPKHLDIPQFTLMMALQGITSNQFTGHDKNHETYLWRGFCSVFWGSGSSVLRYVYYTLIALTRLAVLLATSLALCTNCLLATGLLVLPLAMRQALHKADVCLATTVAADSTCKK